MYDKTNDKQFPSNSINLALKRNFYKINKNDDNFFEHFLSKLENSHAPAIKRLIEERNYDILDDEDKTKICEFLSLLYTRTEVIRLDIKHFIGDVIDHFDNENLPPNLKKTYLSKFKNLIYPQNALKALHARCILSFFLTSSIIFSKMKFIMIENKTCYSFWTSDNPLSRQNEFDKNRFGNMGLFNTGIEFYLPLTPDLTLGILDPITFHNIPLWLNADKMHAIRLNFLQVDSSNRFIYSEYKRFYLLKNMLDSHAHYRDPNRKRFEFFKGMDSHGRTILLHAGRNLQHPVNLMKPMGELQTWIDPNVVDDLFKKYSFN